MTPEESLSRLGPAELPAFAHTLSSLSALRREGEALPAGRAANIILADPYLSLRVLHRANNRTRHEPNVCMVEHALMMSGLQSFMDSLHSIAPLEGTALGRDSKAMAGVHVLLRRAQHAAWQARDFAVLHRDMRAEEVQVAALLHHIPMFLMWLKTPQEAKRLTRLYRRMAPDEAEQEVLGQSMADLLQSLLDAWCMPELIRDLLDKRSQERDRQVILRASLGIAEHCQRGWWAPALLDDFELLAGVENMALEQVIATAHANAVRVARQSDWIAAPPAGTWLVMAPGDWPEEPEDEEIDAPPARPAPAPQAPIPRPKAAEKPAEPATPIARTKPEPRVEAHAETQAAVRRIPDSTPVSVPAPSTSPPVPAPPAAPQEPMPRVLGKPAAEPAGKSEAAAEAVGHACPMPSKQAYQESLKGIEGHLDRSLNLNQMSAVILKGLHSGLGLSRIIFAMATPDGKRVKGRFTLGIPANDPLRHFEFELEGHDLFAQLMKKMQGVWLNDDNRARLWPLLSPHMQEILGEGDFYAMSMLSGSRPIGLIYADRGHAECGLDPMTYTDFKMLCLQAARGLSQVKG